MPHRHQLIAGTAFVAMTTLLLAAAAKAAMQTAPPSLYGANVREAAEKISNLSMALSAVQQLPQLASYVFNESTRCTIVAPTNAAYQSSLSQLGARVGLVAQNASLLSQMMHYHVLPVALTAAQLGALNKTMTLANETLFIHTARNGTVEVYSNPKVPAALQLIDIRAGNCLIHTIDAVLPPPSLLPTIEAWIVEAGHPSPQLAREEWAPVQEPLPPPAGSAAAQPGTAASAPADSASPQPASSGDRHGCGPGLVLLAALVAAVLL